MASNRMSKFPTMHRLLDFLRRSKVRCGIPSTFSSSETGTEFVREVFRSVTGGRWHNTIPRPRFSCHEPNEMLHMNVIYVLPGPIFPCSSGVQMHSGERPRREVDGDFPVLRRPTCFTISGCKCLTPPHSLAQDYVSLSIYISEDTTNGNMKYKAF